MVTVVGSYDKVHGYFRMFGTGKIYSTTYIGYSFKQMQAKYRKDNDLVGKHINWVITGWEDK